MNHLKDRLPELRHVLGLLLALRFPRQAAAGRALLWTLDHISRKPERGPDRRKTRVLGGALIVAGLALPLLIRGSRQG